MKIKSFLAVLIASVFFGCNNNPKVIPVTSENANPNASHIFSGSSNDNVDFNTPMADEFHKVVVNEILPTSKYVYLNVTEDGDKYWIATRSMEATVGETYYYKGGLLKTNFESKEYNRVFDKVYLIGNLVTANHANASSMASTGDFSNTNQSAPQKEDIPMHAEKIVKRQGSMKIADLVKDPKKYEGKTIQLDGICTKINAGIMDRNWIHIKDGSKDDYDLVITSDAFVPEGAAFTMKAVVVLNKDFGAGYTYDLILEQGVLIK
jgi:hypothetical protein